MTSPRSSKMANFMVRQSPWMHFLWFPYGFPRVFPSGFFVVLPRHVKPSLSRKLEKKEATWGVLGDPSWMGHRLETDWKVDVLSTYPPCHGKTPKALCHFVKLSKIVGFLGNVAFRQCEVLLVLPNLVEIGMTLTKWRNGDRPLQCSEMVCHFFGMTSSAWVCMPSILSD